MPNPPDSPELGGRVALITGAARGQGRAIARRLHAAGASVIAGDIATDELGSLSSELGKGIVVGQLDIGDAAQWSEIVEQGVAALGGLDILVNNAGVLRRASIDVETEQDFTEVWRVNCLGAFLGMQACLPHLRRSPHAAVVNTASTAGRSAWSGHAAYVSSKWAVLGLTRVAALELAADGIRVNAVLPGPIATPMILSGLDPEAERRLSRVPLNRLGRPEEVAEAVLFLVSDRSTFLTGSELTIDGGQTSGVVTPIAQDHRS